MSSIATVVGGNLLSGYFQKEGAKDAADAQKDAAQQGLNIEREQFEAIKALLAPYRQTGEAAMDEQMKLAGLQGQPIQQAQMQEIVGSEKYQDLVKRGETTMLQNASAGGNLRGSNLQNELAQYRPQVLNQLVAERFGRLGQVASLGQASATGQAAAGQNFGNSATNLFAQQGAARAGESLATGQFYNNALQGITTGAAMGKQQYDNGQLQSMLRGAF